MSCHACASRLGASLSWRAREAATPAYAPLTSCLSTLDRKRAVNFLGQTQHPPPKRLKVEAVVHAAASSASPVDDPGACQIPFAALLLSSTFRMKVICRAAVYERIDKAADLLSLLMYDIYR